MIEIIRTHKIVIFLVLSMIAISSVIIHKSLKHENRRTKIAVNHIVISKPKHHFTNDELKELKPPTEITIEPGDGNILLEWKGIQSNVTYNLKRKDANNRYITINNEPLQKPITIDNHLMNGIAYHYVVTTLMDGVESRVSNVVAATPLAMPRPPKNLHIDSTTTDSVNISWDKSADASLYHIYANTYDGKYGWEEIAQSLSNKINITSLKPGVECYLNIVAQNYAGYSSSSNSIRIINIPDSPAMYKTDVFNDVNVGVQKLHATRLIDIVGSKNLIRNSGFNHGSLKSWSSLGHVSVVKMSGSSNYYMAVLKNGSLLKQVVYLKPDTRYILVGSGRLDDKSGDISIRIMLPSGGYRCFFNVDKNIGALIDFKTTKIDTYCTLIIERKNGSGNGYFSDFILAERDKLYQ